MTKEITEADIEAIWAPVRALRALADVIEKHNIIISCDANFHPEIRIGNEVFVDYWHEVDHQMIRKLAKETDRNYAADMLGVNAEDLP